MDYINLVDVKNKKMYDLGKRSSAKFYLPYAAYIFNGKPIVIFGDETHSFLEDKYELKQYGGEYDECSLENYDADILTDIEMSYAEFEEIFEKIGGKEISNLEEYIRYKYRKWKAGF